MNNKLNIPMPVVTATTSQANDITSLTEEILQELAKPNPITDTTYTVEDDTKRYLKRSAKLKLPTGKIARKMTHKKSTLYYVSSLEAGQVTRYNPHKGFGFMETSDGDVYFHATAYRGVIQRGLDVILDGDGIETANERADEIVRGTRILFYRAQREKGSFAHVWCLQRDAQDTDELIARTDTYRLCRFDRKSDGDGNGEEVFTENLWQGTDTLALALYVKRNPLIESNSLLQDGSHYVTGECYKYQVQRGSTWVDCEVPVEL
jgi:cold shock CspA family protein